MMTKTMQRTAKNCRKQWNRFWSHADQIPMKRMAAYAGILFVLSLIPLLLLGRYNVMCVDDYDYGRQVHDTWLATGSLWQSVQTAWRQNMEFYRDWQGTYISCFLMALCPMNFDYGVAYVVPILMVCVLATSTYALGRHLLHCWLGLEKAGSCFVMFTVLFMFYQVMDAPFEGIYWYNGATHYVLMESIWFFCLTAISLSLWAQKRSRELVWCAAAALMAVIVGGGNLVTGLQAEILMALLIVYAAVTDRKKIVTAVIPFVTGSVGFLFNVLAPGNTRRSTLDTDVGYSAVLSILLSFYHAVVFIIRWTPAFVIVIWVMLLPVLWKLVKGSKSKFCHPVWVTLGAFCVFSAMFTPTLYAVGMVGMARVDNIIQIVYYLCLIMVTAYWLGYFAHRGAEADIEAKQLADIAVSAEAASGGGTVKGLADGTEADSSADAVVNIEAASDGRMAGETFGSFLEKTGGRLTVACIIITIVMWLLTADKNTYTSISALRSLVNGDAQTFYAEAMERHELYIDEGIAEVEIRPYSARPSLFDFNDLTEDEGNWLNLAVTRYYHKTYVKVVE